MEQIIEFIKQFGWPMGLIAISGIIILGVLKYADVFKNIEKAAKKRTYLLISVGLSIFGACIYLLATKQFTFAAASVFSTAVLALNQSIYSVYENFSLRDLFNKFVEWLERKIIPTTKE